MKTENKKNNIPEGWAVTRLGEVAEVNALVINKDYHFNEIEYIEVASVEDRKLLQTQKLILESAPSRAKRIVRNDDILISTVRPNLKHFCFIKTSKPNLVASTGFAVVSAKRAYPYFLYNLLTTEKYTEYLTQIADTHTSTYPAFNPEVILNSKFLLPSLTEQRAIAAIFSSLDDKIELLREQNKTLEGVAQAIYKRWFVDFEFPVEQENALNSPPFKEGWQPKADGVVYQEGCPKGGVIPDRIVNNKSILKTFRKQLRNNLTPAEAKLWTYLKNKQLDGRKFRRQFSVDNYILDFYCPSEKLGIELDGEVHNIETQAEYDIERELFLSYYGIKVLRFENKLVFENPDYILDCIKKEFGKDTTPSALLPPRPSGTPPFKEGSWELKGYKSSGGTMVESELGEIPEGWEIGRLTELFDFIE